MRARSSGRAGRGGGEVRIVEPAVDVGRRAGTSTPHAAAAAPASTRWRARPARFFAVPTGLPRAAWTYAAAATLIRPWWRARSARSSVPIQAGSRASWVAKKSPWASQAARAASNAASRAHRGADGRPFRSPWRIVAIRRPRAVGAGTEPGVPGWPGSRSGGARSWALAGAPSGPASLRRAPRSAAAASGRRPANPSSARATTRPVLARPPAQPHLMPTPRVGKSTGDPSGCRGGRRPARPATRRRPHLVDDPTHPQPQASKLSGSSRSGSRSDSGASPPGPPCTSTSRSRYASRRRTSSPRCPRTGAR